MKHLLIGSIMVGLLLSGCGQSGSGDNAATNGDYNVESKTDLSNYPLAVQNGEVTPEYHDALFSWIDEMTSKSKESHQYSYEYSDSAEDRENKAQKVKDIEYSVKLINEKFDTLPTTEIESEIQKTVNDMIYNQELSLKYKSDFLNSLNSTDRNLQEDYGKEAQDAGNYLVEQLEEYNMFLEN